MVSSSQWETWGRWAKELEIEIIHFHNRHHMWEEMVQAIEAGNHPDRGYFLRFFNEIWAAAQAAAIRRIRDERRDVVSLHRLLREIQSSAGQVTKELFLRVWDLDQYDESDEHDRHQKRFMTEDADSYWEQITGDRNSQVLSRRRVGRDVAALKKATNVVKAFVDDNLAHRSAGARSTATFEDLDTAMAAIVEIFRRYELLLRGASPITMTPTIQGDWKGPFRSALF